MRAEKSKKLEWELKDSNRTKFTVDELKFIFDQAEKHLKQSVEISNAVVTRTTILLTVSVGLFGSLFAFVFSQWYNGLWYFSDVIVWVSTLVLAYLLILIFYMAKNIKGYSYRDIGSEPKALLHDHFVETIPDNSIGERTAYYYISEIQDYQVRIEKNKKTNEERWGNFHFALYGLVFLPIVVFVIYFLSNVFIF